jgi:hypothetical protein
MRPGPAGPAVTHHSRRCGAIHTIGSRGTTTPAVSTGPAEPGITAGPTGPAITSQ